MKTICSFWERLTKGVKYRIQFDDNTEYNPNYDTLEIIVPFDDTVTSFGYDYYNDPVSVELLKRYERDFNMKFKKFDKYVLMTAKEIIQFHNRQGIMRFINTHKFNSYFFLFPGAVFN